MRSLLLFPAVSLFGNAGNGWRYEGNCLDPSPARPTLDYASKVMVIVEVNDWPSQQLVAAAFAVLASELLGYDVRFNHVSSSHGVFRRAAWMPTEGEEGDLLRSLELPKLDCDTIFCYLKQDRHFEQRHVYFNPEVWRTDKLHEIASAQSSGRAIEVGAIGYSGLAGVYVPHAFADDPYNLRFYNALLDGRNYDGTPSGRNEELFGKVAQAFPAVQEECRTAERCFASERVVSVVSDGECKLWCGGSQDAPRKIPLVITSHFKGWFEEIVANNVFDIAIQPIPGIKDFEARVKEIVQNEEPSLFYHWSPSALFSGLSPRGPQRVLLPIHGDCGSFPNRSRHECGTACKGEGVSDWKCDLPLDPLTKVASRSAPQSRIVYRYGRSLYRYTRIAASVYGYTDNTNFGRSVLGWYRSRCLK